MFAREFRIYPYLDTRYRNKEGLYHIKIAISKDRKTDYIGINLYSTPDEWVLLESKKVPKKLIEKKSIILQAQDKIVYLVNSLTIVDIQTVKTLFSRQPVKEPELVVFTPCTDVFDYFKMKINELEKKEAWGTVDNYLSSASFYRKYLKLNSCEFSYITPLKLIEIEKKAEKEMSKANIYRHARHLRHLFNIALLDGVIDKKQYPFHKRGYMIPQARKTKKALTKESMIKLLSYEPQCNEEQIAIDYFVFSFFGNGMNMKDVAHLRFENLHGNIIRFKREKTKNTSTEPPIITTAVTQEMKEVINRQGRVPVTIKDYIFPILMDNGDTKQQYIDHRNQGRVVNQWLDKICKKLDIPKITHGVSRHTFATALKLQGVSTTYIQEALGHTSLATTEHYLASFTDDIIIDHTNKLKEFIRPL